MRSKKQKQKKSLKSDNMEFIIYDKENEVVDELSLLSRHQIGLET